MALPDPMPTDVRQTVPPGNRAGDLSTGDELKPHVAPFADVPALLARMDDGHRPPLGRFFLLGLLAVFGGWLWLGWTNAGGRRNANDLLALLAPLLLLLLMASAGGMFVITARRLRRERSAVDAVEELIQLRRWPAAADRLAGLLARPVASRLVRGRALVNLAAVLARDGRYAEAIVVQSYLLDRAPLDPATAYFVKLGRAMAMLHDDRLTDADRAITDARKFGGREAGPLALVELYRDVRTNHPAEAVAVYEGRLPAMRGQLGHRSADAHALAAWAYDRLARPADAARAYAAATALASAADLIRRYPELAAVAARYPATPTPSPTE